MRNLLLNFRVVLAVCILLYFFFFFLSIINFEFSFRLKIGDICSSWSKGWCSVFIQCSMFVRSFVYVIYYKINTLLKYYVLFSTTWETIDACITSTFTSMFIYIYTNLKHTAIGMCVNVIKGGKWKDQKEASGRGKVPFYLGGGMGKGGAPTIDYGNFDFIHFKIKKKRTKVLLSNLYRINVCHCCMKPVRSVYPNRKTFPKKSNENNLNVNLINNNIIS